jgi:CBS domain-containing protein
MQKSDTGVVPVVDGRKIVGLITDRDIVVRLVADGKDPVHASVREAMTKHVRSVREDANVEDVLDLMSSAQVRRVPVVNASDELVGIVSMADLADETGRRRVGETIREISEAPPNN